MKEVDLHNIGAMHPIICDYLNSVTTDGVGRMPTAEERAEFVKQLNACPEAKEQWNYICSRAKTPTDGKC